MSIAKVYEVNNLNELAYNYLKIADDILSSSGVIIYPTDTIYGILGRGDKKDIYSRIYKIKNRSKDKSFILLIGNKKLIYSLWDEDFIDLYQNKIENWLEKVTYIGKMKKNFLLSDFFTSKRIAIRYTNKYWIKKLAIKYPLIATSPNFSASSYKQIIDAFLLLKVDAVFFVRNYPTSKPSKIIELSNNVVVRE